MEPNSLNLNVVTQYHFGQRGFSLSLLRRRQNGQPVLELSYQARSGDVFYVRVIPGKEADIWQSIEWKGPWPRDLKHLLAEIYLGVRLDKDDNFRALERIHGDEESLSETGIIDLCRSRTRIPFDEIVHRHRMGLLSEVEQDFVCAELGLEGEWDMVQFASICAFLNEMFCYGIMHNYEDKLKKVIQILNWTEYDANGVNPFQHSTFTPLRMALKKNPPADKDVSPFVISFTTKWDGFNTYYRSDGYSQFRQGESGSRLVRRGNANTLALHGLNPGFVERTYRGWSEKPGSTIIRKYTPFIAMMNEKMEGPRQWDFS
jgi:hypothetical protein